MKRLAVAGALALAACSTTPDATIVAAGPANDTNARPVARWEGDEYAPPQTTTTARASRSSRPRPAPVPAGRRAGGDVPRAYGVRLVSTAYCLTGTMANGQRVHNGAVAMNGVPFGTKYRVLDGPLAGNTYVVADRIGHGSQFDIWMGSCANARQYGRRTITVERVG